MKGRYLSMMKKLAEGNGSGNDLLSELPGWTVSLSFYHLFCAEIATERAFALEVRLSSRVGSEQLNIDSGQGWSRDVCNELQK